jgi:hypothetical protein
MYESFSSIFKKRLCRVVMKYLAVAKEGIRYALKQYAKYGVRLSYMPTVRPVYGEADNLEDIAAVWGGEEEVGEEAIQAFLSFSGNNDSAKTVWKRFYGIDVSLEALRESTDAFRSAIIEAQQKKEFYLKEPDLDYECPVDDGYIEEGEIVLYHQFRMIRNREARLAIMAHECWHLVEQEKGVFQETPLITEGTATYAKMLLFGDKFNRTGTEGMRGLMYNRAAVIIQNRCKDSRNPFKSMLDRGFRQEAQQEFIDYLANIPMEVYAVYFKSMELLQQMAILRAFAPELVPPKNPSLDELLGYYKRIGSHKLVRELEGQDLSKFLEWCGFIF